MRTYFYLTILLLGGIAFSPAANAQRGRHSYRYYQPYRSYSHSYYRPYYRPPILSFGAFDPFYRRSYVSIPFGGINYRYNDGYFYRPYGTSFQVIFPPIGIRIHVLPRSHRRIMVGPDVYFYSNGIFYRHDRDDYEVVAPPVGAQVAELPENARVVVIDNKKYFEYHGTYYRETPKENGEMWYTVTGKNGVVTAQDQDEQLAKEEEPSQEMEIIRPELGTKVSNLPGSVKTVVINNQKYFVSTDNTYYQEVIENNQILYKVVGKPSESSN